MFALFPNVQFIVSSHSPFLNMGLATELSEKHKIFDLNHNGISCSATKNEQYEEVYKMMIGENERFAKLYEDLNEKITTLTKPLIITEGKTDIKHILKAKEKLGITDLDFDTIQEGQQPNGDSDLHDLLEQAAHLNNKNRIIGIYADVLEAITSHDYDEEPSGDGEKWNEYRYPFHEDMSEDAYNDV